MEKKRWFASTLTKRLVVSILIIIQLLFIIFVAIRGIRYSALINVVLKAISLLVAFNILNLLPFFERSKFNVCIIYPPY